MRAGFAAMLALLAGTAAAGAQEVSGAASATGTGASANEPDRPARSRPLFAPTRRPPAIHVAAPVPAMPVLPPPPPKTPPQLRLIGVVQGADQTFAVVRASQADTAITLRTGDRFEAWDVARIDAESLLLRDGSREQEYRLFTVTLGAGDYAVPVRPEPAAR